MKNNEGKSKWFSQTENKWLIAGVLIVIISIINPFFIMWISNSKFKLTSFEKLGTVGDFFGGSTVGLLSLASIFFIISTIVMQRKELGMQREELQMTRDELAKANDQYEITNKTMKLQQFETTLFNMNNLYNEVLKDVYHPTTKVKGRDALKAHYDSVNEYYHVELVQQFVEKFLSPYENDYDTRIKSMAEAIGYLIVGNYKEEQEFQVFVREEVTVENIISYVIKEEGRRRFHIYGFDYRSLDKLSEIIPENLLVKSFMSEFVPNYSIKKGAFGAAVAKDDFMLSNVINVLKMVLQFIDGEGNVGNNLTVNEKNVYVKIFISQFSMIETTLLQYYIELGDDEELKALQRKYSITSYSNVYGNSIAYH